MQQSVEANCHFEELSSADLLSTVQSLPESSGSFLINDPIGKGYEIFLRWAISDIQIAASASESDKRDRYATNAIMSARRSLSCLVDQYLVRDGIAFCQDAPQDARAKAEVLIERGILDSLASDVLQKAITKRNQIEHDSKTATTPTPGSQSYPETPGACTTGSSTSARKRTPSTSRMRWARSTVTP